MENLKNKFIFLLIGIFILFFTPLVQSWEFDNVKSYDKETKIITIKNSLLGLPLDKVAEIELKTPLNFKVPSGYQKVAEFEIRNYEDYTNALKQLNFYNLRDENKEFLRSFDYKYKTYINVSVDDYENVDIGKSGNGTTIYERQLIGSHLELREKWVNLNSSDFNKDDVLTIGIFTEVKRGDIVEWIPTFYGKEITEWAVWTASLNVGLVSYYKLDNNDFTDSLGINNGTNTGTINTSGIIIDGRDFDGTQDFITVGNDASLNMGTGNFSIQAWVKTTSATSQQIISKFKNSASFDGYGLTIDTVGLITFQVNVGTNAFGDVDVSDGGWHHIVATYEGNTVDGMKIYVDGVEDVSARETSGTPNLDNTNSLYIGIAQDGTSFDMNGDIDETGIWNRTLNALEISDLYNNGTGISYTDIVFPIVTLNSPVDTFNTTSQTINFNGSITSSLVIINVTLIIDGINNETNSSGINDTDYLFTKVISDGNHNWTYESCNVDGCENATVRTFTIDSIFPIINISAPIGILDFGEIGNNETLNVTFTDVNLDTCWFNYNGTNITIDGCISGALNSTDFILEENNLNITVYANDSFGNENSSFTSWSYQVLQLNLTFEENITEGESDDFSLLLNISSGSSLTDTIFSYNGTNYTTTIIFSSGLYLISSSIISPTVDADTNFSFNFFFTVDDINYSTTPNEQLVLNSLFDICGGISNDTLLNMSLVDEETEISINGTIEIVADIVSKSSGVTVGIINNTFENVEFAAICFSPVSSYPLYNLNTEIKYFSDGYVAELYYIQNSDMTNYPRNLTLFDLNQNDSTEFVITFQNDAFIFVEGAIVQLQRKYIGENVYKVVEAPRTADGGKAIVHIDLTTNIYRVSVVKDGELLKFFDEIVFTCENELIGDCEEQLLGDVNPNNDVPIENLLDFSYSVSVSDDNNTVNVLFAIPSGTPSSINVLLEQFDMFGNVTSCNTTVITSAGSITCGFSDTIEKSILQLTISKDDTQLAITNYGVDPKLDMDGMNFFIVFLFLISLVGMAIASPEWMMIIGIMTFMISGTLLLLNGMSLAMGLGAMAWLVVAVIIIILKMAKQEDR